MKVSLLVAISVGLLTGSCSRHSGAALDPMYAEASNDIYDSNGVVIGHRDAGDPDPYRPTVWDNSGAGYRARSLLERIDPAWVAPRHANASRSGVPQPVVVPPHPPVVTSSKVAKPPKRAFLEAMVTVVPNKTDKELDQ